ncbi:MAG: DHH family phosphoesterase [Pseudomonadales bacterium]
MASIDIFNGDADGICALTQLRLSQPKDSQLVTGVKRDIALVAQAEYGDADDITVLDISFDKNRDGVSKALEAGANILYFDHHFAGDIPAHASLETHINTASDTCTSMLVNEYLKGAFRAWAVVGAFGDNLAKSANSIAKPLALSETELEQLEALGTYLNYNGYGASLDDLLFTPSDLYRKVSVYADPLEFIKNDTATFNRLEQGYQQDMSSAANIAAEYCTNTVAVFRFPDEAWARRVSGVYSNDLANANPDRAHAVLTEKAGGTLLVSVRAPLNNKTGADEICRQFPTGGGRKAAAGINDLPAQMLSEFIETMERFYKS